MTISVCVFHEYLLFLGGKLDRHFLLESCPVYHNLTRKACRDFRADTAKRAAARKKALTALATRSPLGSPSSEQKKNSHMVCKYVSIHSVIICCLFLRFRSHKYLFCLFLSYSFHASIFFGPYLYFFSQARCYRPGWTDRSIFLYLCTS